MRCLTVAGEGGPIASWFHFVHHQWRGTQRPVSFLTAASMIGRLLETLTGKDDVERVAYKDDPLLLLNYLKTRKLFFPKRLLRTLDAATFTEDQLIKLIEEESKALGSQIDLWILEVDGKKRLPAFSSRKAMEAFSARMSKDLNRVFSLGCIEVLLSDILKGTEVDIVDLNLFSKRSWEITATRRNE